ncbi:unnamed protein product [Parajaminaea phylloscopi]
MYGSASAEAGPSRLPGPLPHLAHIDFPNSHAVATGSVSNSSSSSNVQHHLFPSAISPTMDLVLLFSTTAPSASAGATSGQENAGAAAASNFAGLSAAQRLIQQRMAMMRARAAAAAGLPTSSGPGGAGSDGSAGPLKGHPVEMSLWRTGNGPELVWKKQTQAPDAILQAPGEPGGRRSAQSGGTVAPRPQQTQEVFAMQWSPDGRSFAIHAAIARQPGSMTSFVALYSIHDGRLLHLTPLDHLHSSRAPEFPRAMAMQWTTTNIKPDTQRRRQARPTKLPLVSAFVASQRAQSAGPSGAGRFQHLMGGGGGGGQKREAADSKFVLPSQRGFESEQCSEKSGAEDEELGDYVRDWSTLAVDRSSESTPLTMLVVPGLRIDGDERQGFHFLMDGRVSIAFVPVPPAVDDAALAALSALACQDGSIILTAAQRRKAGCSLATVEYRIPCLSPVSTEARLLSSLLDLSSVVRYHTLSALDHVYVLAAAFRVLSDPTANEETSLSAHQVSTLPPLRRFQHTLRELSNNHVQDMKTALVTSLSTGMHSDMVESLLLNSLSEGRWRSMREGIVKMYEVMEFVAGQLIMILTTMTRHLAELSGFAQWTEKTCTLLPAEVEGQTWGPFVRRLLASMSALHVTAHQVIAYSQGERLAWEEMERWVQWERDRLEMLKSDKADPMDPKTFDPLVVMELVLRDFECKELKWILLAHRESQDDDEGEARLDADADADDLGMQSRESEASFDLGARRAAELSKQDEPGVEPLRQTNESSAMSPDASLEGLDEKPVSASDQLGQTLQWLRGEETRQGKSAGGAAAASPSVKAPPPPRDPFQKLFQAGTTPCDEDRPSVYTRRPLFNHLRSVAASLRAVFRGVPRAHQGGGATSAMLGEVTLPEDLVVEALDNVAARQETLGDVVSLAVPPSSGDAAAAQTRDQWAQTLRRRYSSRLLVKTSPPGATGSPRCLLTVIGEHERGELLMIWQELGQSATAVPSRALRLRLQSRLRRVHFLDDARLAVVRTVMRDAPDGADVGCQDVGATTEVVVADVTVLETLATGIDATTTMTTPSSLRAEEEGAWAASVVSVQTLHGQACDTRPVELSSSESRDVVGILQWDQTSSGGGRGGGQRLDLWAVQAGRG